MYRQEVGPYRIFGNRAEEDQRARIAQIAAVEGVRALVDLLPFLPPETHRLGPDAANAVAAVLERSPALDLAWLDQASRRGTGWWIDPWNKMRLVLPDWARECRGVVALASFHAYGYVRESAVHVLSDVDDGFELPYLLLRTNDWVDVVHGAALAAVRQRVTRSYARHWIHCLGLVERLRSVERRESALGRLLRDVDALLFDPEVRPLIEKALGDTDLRVRRAAVRIAVAVPGYEGKRLLLAALQHRDPVVAIGAAQALFQRAREDLSALVRQALRHPLALVRALALEGAVRHGAPDIEVVLRDLLLDPVRSVRELARHELAKRAPTLDVQAEYRRAFTEGHRASALEGLAEVGTREDLDVFRAHLRNPNARMRAAALVGIGRCAGDEHLDDLEAALQDPSSTVRRAVAQYAKRHLGRGVVQRARRAFRAPRERTRERREP